MARRRVFIRRVVTDSQRWRIVLLADWGFHGKYIAGLVSQHDHSVSVGTVYRVCRQAGVRLRAYRDGKGRNAASAVQASKRSRGWHGRRKAS